MAFLDANGLLYLWQKITSKFVAKEEGKGLSSNDYTSEEKTKLSGISTGANKTTVENVLTSTSQTNALSSNMGKVLDEKIKALSDNMGDLGYGDMMKATYDTDNNGKVDNADNSDKLGGQLPSYYAEAEHSHTTDDIDNFEYEVSLRSMLFTVLQTGVFPDGLCSSDGVIKPYPGSTMIVFRDEKIGELYSPKGYDSFWLMYIAQYTKMIYFPFVAAEDVTPTNGNLTLKTRWLEGDETFDISLVVPSALPLRAGRGYMLVTVTEGLLEGGTCEATIIGLDPPIDTTPTANSTNLLTSGAIYTALQNVAVDEHTHEQSDINGLEKAIGDMTEIAQGKCASYVFATVSELETWLKNTTNTANLKVGDVFLIKAVDVPDYWWDGSAKQVLETTKVNLTAITNAEIDTIVAS